MSKATQSPSELFQALLGHEAEKIPGLVAAGETLAPGENLIEAIANGMHPDDMDLFHCRSAKRIGKTLAAAQDSGLDINQPVDGEPAAHFVTRRFVTDYAAYRYDRSQAAMYGLTDQDHIQYLAAFAEAGVDFSARTEHGKGFMQTAETALVEYVAKTAPETISAFYTREEDWDHPSIADVRKDLNDELLTVKRAAQDFEIRKKAEALASQKVSTAARGNQGAGIEI